MILPLLRLSRAKSDAENANHYLYSTLHRGGGGHPADVLNAMIIVDNRNFQHG